MTDLLRAEKVTVRFAGVVALNNVDLSVRSGEVFGLIGPNGAGKTTMVNVLSGFQRPSEGSVSFDGTDVTRWSSFRRAREGMARTFQGARLFPRLSVRENVEAGGVSVGMSRAGARRKATEILERLDLADRADAPGASLPHGDERRLGIARALSTDPTLLMLDEPAAGLNEEESDELLDLLQRLPGEFSCSILIIEHDMRLMMRLCDRIQVLDHGATLAVGTPAEVRTDPDVLAAYLGTEEAEREVHGDTVASDVASTPARPGSEPTETLLEVSGLRVEYAGVPALHGVDLTVGRGEVVGVIGPNGAGKTSMLTTIAGLQSPAAGTITHRGEAIGGTRPEEIVRRGISLVPEGRHIFGTLTVAENLALGATTGSAVLDDALDEVFALFPVLERLHKHSAAGLSGGEQQQLAIARALIAQPELLMLDEPSLGLAPLIVDVVFETLERLRAGGKTILLVEQEARRTIRFADRSYVLQSGSIVASGTGDELSESEELAEAYLSV